MRLSVFSIYLSVDTLYMTDSASQKGSGDSFANTGWVYRKLSWFALVWFAFALVCFGLRWFCFGFALDWFRFTAFPRPWRWSCRCVPHASLGSPAVERAVLRTHNVMYIWDLNSCSVEVVVARRALAWRAEMVAEDLSPKPAPFGFAWTCPVLACTLAILPCNLGHV